MKALIPYALLGLIGTGGALVGTGAFTGPVPSSPAPLPAPTPAPGDGAVRITASLDRTALPATGGDAFLRVALEGIKPAQEETSRIPVSLTLVIDRSGSMGMGNKMELAKQAALEAIASLRPGDKVCTVSFDDGAESHGCGTVGEASATAKMERAIAKLTSRGGTDMASGLRVGGTTAMSVFDSGHVNRLLLLSDGQLNQGIVEPPADDCVKYGISVP